jgi:hypothetical protein
VVGKPDGRNHLEDLGLDGRVLLKWIFKHWNVSIDWIDLAQDRNRWRSVVKVAMNLRISKNEGKFLTS